MRGGHSVGRGPGAGAGVRLRAARGFSSCFSCRVHDKPQCEAAPLPPLDGPGRVWVTQRAAPREPGFRPSEGVPVIVILESDPGPVSGASRHPGDFQLGREPSACTRPGAGQGS